VRKERFYPFCGEKPLFLRLSIVLFDFAQFSSRLKFIFSPLYAVNQYFCPFFSNGFSVAYRLFSLVYSGALYRFTRVKQRDSAGEKYNRSYSPVHLPLPNVGL
jgi:hypothetical protein